jgi:hypothetical protein
VVADRLGAEVETLRHLGVRLVAGYELEDLALGELGEGACRRAGRA